MLSFTTAAREDLLAIENALAAHGAPTADRFVARARRRFQQLGEHPLIGRPRPDLGPDLRSLVLDQWIVIYRARPEKTLVLRVLHGARDMRKVAWPTNSPE